MEFNLPQLDKLVKINDGTSDEKFGYYPNNRPIAQLLSYGLILLDKPPGTTSHEIVSYVKKILGLEKAGHSGTLDPGTTGLLPIGLDEGTKIVPGTYSWGQRNMLPWLDFIVMFPMKNSVKY